MGLSFQFALKGERIEAHLFHHREQTIATGGREVVAQSYAIDEVEVACQNVGWRLSVEDADEQGHDALDDECVALCSVIE